MCGRTCLTLDPNQIICACKYKPIKLTPKKNISSNTLRQKENDLSDYLTPEWRSEFNCGRKYIPSPNIAPTDIAPVIVSAQHFGNDGSEDGQSRVVVPMMWGMIPFWHKGDYRKHGLTTNNCRLENLMESKLYKGPFQRGQRCVVLCEGFYEWQTTKPAKPSERAAHYLYMPQADDVTISDKSTWSPENINLMQMAGLFDVWEDNNGDTIFSFSVITFESSKIMSWLHHRMPAILETEEQVNNWLDYTRIKNDEALSTLRPTTQLKWHRVSNLVNNSRNKSDQCNKLLDLGANQKPSGLINTTILDWLNVTKLRESETENNSKRLKFQE